MEIEIVWIGHGFITIPFLKIINLAFIVMASIIGFYLHKDWKNAEQKVNQKSNILRRF